MLDQSFPWLTAMVVVPALGAVVLWALPATARRNARTIAVAFSLSEHTVKIHLHNIIAKLGVSNRTQAAAKYREAATRRTAGNF